MSVKNFFSILGGVLLGLVLGACAGAFTRVYSTGRGIEAKAGLAAAAFWTTGVLLRTIFSLYATMSGAAADRRGRSGTRNAGPLSGSRPLDVSPRRSLARVP